MLPLACESLGVVSSSTRGTDERKKEKKERKGKEWKKERKVLKKTIINDLHNLIIYFWRIFV